jgi:hypothetical protein
VPGEYIADVHILAWVDPAYRGSAKLEVGLYDPLTSERLLTPEGASRLLLPSEVSVR